MFHNLLIFRKIQRGLELPLPDFSQLLHVLAHFGEIFSHGFSHGIQAPQQTTGRLESILATEKVHSSPVCSPAAQNLLTSSFQPR